MGSPFCLGCLLSEVVRLFLDNYWLASLVNQTYFGLENILEKS